MRKKRVVVGMSGGVDSSAAAWLLKQEGYEVIGVTMQIWQPESACAIQDNGGCCGLSAVEDARRVAQTIGIPYYVMNFRDVFQRTVIDYFIREYTSGRTPNPCIACNRHVKWEALLRRSMEIGADYIATGHYARKKLLDNGRYVICNSATAAKDQTYALYNLTQEQLAHTLFPDGDYTKPQIREIAEKAGLPVAHKADSQEICFVPDKDYAAFIAQNSAWKDKPGNFVDREGRILGRHKGITHYTIGQRRGLDLPVGKRIFVTDIRPKTNEVVVGEDRDVFADRLTCRDLNWMGIPDLTPGQELEVTAKIRYSHSGEKAVIRRLDQEEGSGGQVECVFRNPVRAITPGQSVVFYRDDYIAGGGIID